MAIVSEPSEVLSSDSIAQPFIPPTHDGRIQSILELVFHHVKYNPNYPVFQYADANKSLHQVTWIQIGNVMQSVARFVKNHCDIPTDSSKLYIIGILANLDSITYFYLILGIKLSGCVPFPISLRNSAEGISHLLSTTNCGIVFKSEDQRTQALWDASLQVLDGKNKVSHFFVPDLLSLLKLDGLNGSSVSLKLLREFRSEDTCMIYHSSGSTGYPKPISLSNEAIFKWGVGIAYRDSGIDTTTEVVSIHGLPFYHGMVYCLMLSCTMVGTVASVFDPTQDYNTPSPELILNSAVASGSNMMFTLPSFLEAWSKSPESVETLKGFTSIMFAGGPTSRHAGEKLFREGVPLSPLYGSTETGTLGVFLRVGLKVVGWDWIKTIPELDLAFIPVDNGLCKLVVKENKRKTLAVYNTVVDGVPAYDTNDVVERHPTDPTLWKVKNRQDAVIVHSSGEKTNPIPIEECLQRDERIAAAVMFGREQLLAGVIILPTESYAVDTADANQLKSYRNMIWGTVLEANAKSPSHSRIFKEMIIIADPNRSFEYTDKGFPKRHSVLNEYREEIEKLYNSNVEAEMVYDDYKMSLDCGSDLDTAKHLVRSIVRQTLSPSIGDDDNIFSFGADSLCALSIRNNVVRVLSDGLPSSEAHSLIPTDLIFSHPTINSFSLIISKFSIWTQLKSSLVAHKNEEPSAETDVAIYLDSLRSTSGMVKFKDGSGDVPLILIPEMSGSAGMFKSCHELFKSTVWSCDTTKVSPTMFTSVHELASFYLNQIKSERPIGPYRLAAYSGSSIILLYLAKLLEQLGDEVMHLAFLDHFPNFFLHRVNDPSVFNPNKSEADLDSYVSGTLGHMYKGMTALAHSDRNTRMFVEALGATLDKRPVNHLMEATIKRISNTIAITIKFLFGDVFRANGVWSRDLYLSWLGSLRTVVPTVYLTTKGLASGCEDPEKEFASGLGVKEAYHNARVVIAPGGHIDILFSKIVIDDLEKDFV